MTREMKFRCWDGKQMWTPEICDDTDFYITCDGEVKFANETGMYERHCSHSYRKGWIVMQFTGLKDKNGVDIYEGDILGACVMNGSIVNAQVTFNGGCYIASALQGEHWGENLFEQCRNEVIGNIYENPELLESAGGIQTPSHPTD